MVNNPIVPGEDRWGGEAIRPDSQVSLDLPRDAVEQLSSVGLPVEIEGMFYATPQGFLAERSFGGR